MSKNTIISRLHQQASCTLGARCAEQISACARVAITVEDLPAKKRAITLRPKTGKGVSRKTSNAFLNMPAFMKGLASITLTGFTAYHVPILFIPAALKMLCEARQLGTVELNEAHACVLLAINECSSRPGDAVPSKEVESRAALIARNNPRLGTDPAPIKKAVAELIRIRCIEMVKGNALRLVEKLRIAS